MADDVLFGRRCRMTLAVPVSSPGDFAHTTSDIVEINGGDDPVNPGMRVQFKIKKTREKEPSPAEVIISNLSATRRQSLQTKGVKLLLEAGYEATGLFRVFAGDVRTVDHTRDGPTWLTHLKCGDGERAFRYARASESFAPGVTAAEVLRYLGKQLGLDDGNVASEAKQIDARFDSGYVVFGSAQQAIDRLLGSLGFGWYVSDGALYVLKTGDALDGIQVPDITPDTGLIGSPEMGSPEKKGQPALLKFKALLTPVRPGGKVKLKSERYDGLVVVKKCEHAGDTHGGEWYTTIEGVIDA